MDGNADGTNTFDIGFHEYDLQAVDTDGDGMVDGAEAIADTSPTNTASVLRLLAVTPTYLGVIVEWQGGTQAWQYLEYCTDLMKEDDRWRPLLAIPPPTLPREAAMHLNVTNASLYYRIRAVR